MNREAAQRDKAIMDAPCPCEAQKPRTLSSMSRYLLAANAEAPWGRQDTGLSARPDRREGMTVRYVREKKASQRKAKPLN
jgi:hypothetical protein